MAHILDSSSDSVLVAELSVSLREELTASIQGAFGVAGELAVTEVSKVIGKAFRDVRDQLHQSLLANRSLRSRLSLAQTELHAARRRVPETRQTRDVAVNTNPVQSEPRIGSLMVVKEMKTDGPGDWQACGAEPFCEIGLDGMECAQDGRPGPPEPPSVQPQHSADIKEDHHSMQENASHADQACIGAGMAHGASAVQFKGRLAFESGHAAKMEEEEEECVHPSSDAEFSSDSLSVVQSKLLEDWRPEPLQSCQSDMYESSNLSALANPSALRGTLAGVDLIASSSCSQPDMCHTTFSRTDSSSLDNPASNSHFLTPSSGQGHALGQYSMPEDVHRYRSVLQPKLGSNQHKTPKRSVYPPGRSPFRCLQCCRDFNRMEHLKIHQRIHTGERPYVCTECTARFRHSWALTRHVRIHTGEKPYLCTQCGRSFRNCGGLRFHQRTHARQSGPTNARTNLEGSGKA